MTTIDVLPEVALLKIFDFCMDKTWIEVWHTLAHVCREWRNVVFGSPRHLDLRLHCQASTPVRKTLDIWPAFPIIIMVHGHEMWGNWGVDNIIAALEHNDRICEISIWPVPSLQMEKVLAAMERPFPALTILRLQPEDETVPVVPASFLGGSAPHRPHPHLQTFFLDRIPFPGLPKLLLSATHLVQLNLWRIPHSGYFSPEVLVTGLSVLTRLRTLGIGFESPQSRPDQRNRRPPPPQTRTLLPVLVGFEYRGVGEYLEDLMARIDAPQLDDLAITLFHQLIFNTSQLTQFIGRTPKLRAHNEARVAISDLDVSVTLSRTFDEVFSQIRLAISCKQPDWQLSSLAQVCSSSFPQALITVVESLVILEESGLRPHLQDDSDIENSQWLDLLHPFAAVKDLYIYPEFVPRIAPVLQELVGESVTEVLPALRALQFREPPSGSVQEAIGQFVAARRLAGHPIAVFQWPVREKNSSLIIDMCSLFLSHFMFRAIY